MRQCLDEAMLQSYFDGELSSSLMESATLHLASCVACATAARELEEETALLSEAFALEFADSVPTEQLRRRIDAAVAGLHVVSPVVQEPSAVSNFFRSLSALFSLSPQRAFGYAALMVVLAFGVIFGLIKMKSSAPPSSVSQTQKQPQIVTPQVPNKNETVAENSNNAIKEVTTNETPKITKVKDRPSTGNVESKRAPVKLLPGEKSYLQTIAKLDSTIKDGQNNMRPALQVEYQRNLQIVDRVIAATRNAAKKNPSDPDAADFMFAAYQSKVDLLNTIADARVYNRTQ